MDNVHFNDKAVINNQKNSQHASGLNAEKQRDVKDAKRPGKSIIQKRNEEQKQKENEISDKIKEVNLTDKNILIQFKVDDANGRRYIELREKGSDKVIRKIPSETMMRIAQNIEDFIDINNDKGLAVDENA